MTMTALGVAVPEIVGLATVETLTGPLTVRLAGATAVNVLTAAVEVPPTFAATAVTEARPAGNVIAVVE
jgi:hypothetical protein